MGFPSCGEVGEAEWTGLVWELNLPFCIPPSRPATAGKAFSTNKKTLGGNRFPLPDHGWPDEASKAKLQPLRSLFRVRAAESHVAEWLTGGCG